MISRNIEASTKRGGRVVVENLHKRFPTPQGKILHVLDDINLSVEPGEFVSIVGPSGCGKTTLLRMMQGLDTFDEGTVTIDGQKPGMVKAGFVFQRASLLPWRTVRQNVSFGTDLAWFRAKSRRDRGEAKTDSKAKVDGLLQLTGLTDFADFYPSQISGGMQQRANLARALAIDPDVLLMDEPFSALDAQTKERMQRELQEIVTRIGTTTVFITHDIREACFLSDRVLVMSGRPGRITKSFTLDRARPRDAEYQQSDEIATLAREIWHALHDTAESSNG